MLNTLLLAGCALLAIKLYLSHTKKHQQHASHILRQERKEDSAPQEETKAEDEPTAARERCCRFGLEVLSMLRQICIDRLGL
jgi:hypothetical protein